MCPEGKSGDEDGLHFVTRFSINKTEVWGMKTMSTLSKTTDVSSKSTTEKQVNCLNIK